MHEVALRWLLNSLSSTTAAFNEKARALSLQESPEPCVYFLLQSKRSPIALVAFLIYIDLDCNKVGPNMCRFSHREITTEICLSDIIVSPKWHSVTSSPPDWHNAIGGRANYFGVFAHDSTLLLSCNERRISAKLLAQPWGIVFPFIHC
jgi:hypothetical protein